MTRQPGSGQHDTAVGEPSEPHAEMRAEDATHTNLSYALCLSERERRLREDLLAWLPPVVIDVHAHANGSGAVRGLTAFGWKQVRSSFPAWSVDDSHAVRRMLYGDSEVRMLRFANPYHGIDHVAANRYLLANAGHDRVALCGLPDDVAYTVGELQSGNYAALKMYPYYFEPPASRILDYFPAEVVEAAAALEVPLIVHLPTPLADCVEELVMFAERFPGARIIVAHLGRQSEATHAARRAFLRVADIPMVTMDCSMATDRGVHRLALETLGPDRIMFGSDEPMNLLRFVEFRHPSLGRRFVSEHPYHWLSPEIRSTYKHLAADAVLLHFAVLASLREAISEVFPVMDSVVAEKVFHANAERWLPKLREERDA